MNGCGSPSVRVLAPTDDLPTYRKGILGSSMIRGVDCLRSRFLVGALAVGSLWVSYRDR